jgi:ABC-2 type transport system permease protein
VATKLNPLTYVVQPMRAAVFGHLEVPAATRAALDPTITWSGWQVPGGVQVLIAVGAALAVLVAGILAFDRTD